MASDRNDTHLMVKDVMGDREMTAKMLAWELGKPEHALVSTLRGMHQRGEVTIIKPKGALAPYKYRLKVIA